MFDRLEILIGENNIKKINKAYFFTSSLIQIENVDSFLLIKKYFRRNDIIVKLGNHSAV